MKKLLGLIRFITYTRGEQNTANTKALRNIIYAGYIERTCWQHWMFFRLFTLCSARVSTFVSVEWLRVQESENGRLVRFWKRTDHWCAFSWSICDKTATIGVSERQFLRPCRHTRIMGRQRQRRGTMGEYQHWQKEVVVHCEGLFREITKVQQHRWQQMQKVSDVSFTNPTSTVGLQFLNL
jgi:hypothetical protein